MFVVEGDEDVIFFDFVAIANEDFVDDSAFEVLYGFSVGVDSDPPWGDDAFSKGSESHPPEESEESDADDAKSDKDDSSYGGELDVGCLLLRRYERSGAWTATSGS